MTPNIQKGTRIRAQWLQVVPNASLAGQQPKLATSTVTVVGTVTHIRGDHPTSPTQIRLWVQPDEGGPEVVVDPQHVRAVL